MFVKTFGASSVDDGFEKRGKNYSKSVSIGTVDFSFFTVPLVSGMRRFLRNKHQCRLIKVDLLSNTTNHPNKDTEYGHTNVGVEEPSLNRTKLLSLALTNRPDVSPEVSFVHSSSMCSCIPPEPQRAENQSSVRLKEMILGFEPSAFTEISSRLRTDWTGLLEMNSNPMPNIYSFNSVFLRVLPSSSSTIVLKASSGDFGDNSPRGIDLADNEHVEICNIGNNGGSEGDLLFSFPQLAGLNVRISHNDEVKGYFYENPESWQEDTMELGGRDDMGQMSCSSVVGMEAKDRLKKAPGRLLQHLIANYNSSFRKD